jgi:phospholipase/lecithinase/hemolysin
LPVLAGVLLLAACGGGDSPPENPASVERVNEGGGAPTTPPPGGFSDVVVFGDSLSDDGAYSAMPLLLLHPKAPYPLPYEFGGQFSVNSAESANWTDRLARRLGLTLSPNLVGFIYTQTPPVPVYLRRDKKTQSPDEAFCGFSVSRTRHDCTNFAQGGARVSNRQGIGHDVIALTLPLNRQLLNFIDQFDRFTPRQLVTVLGGANDVLVAAQQLQAQVAAGADRNAALQDAQQAVGEAADELGVLVQGMLKQGARYLLVYTLPDIALTPLGNSLGRGGRCDRADPTQDCFALSNLVRVFNQHLLRQLVGLPVRVVDGYTLLEQEVAAPQRFGLTNVSAPWCDLETTFGTSMLCSVRTNNKAAGATQQNLGSWLFADELHPTPVGHQIIADATLDAMRSFGWQAR